MIDKEKKGINNKKNNSNVFLVFSDLQDVKGKTMEFQKLQERGQKCEK